MAAKRRRWPPARRARSAGSIRSSSTSRRSSATRCSRARRSTRSPCASSKHGDLDAARRLVTSNLRLVVKIAHEYRRAHRNLLDLIQEGNVGLMAAVKKYDPYRGVKLSSYAAWWIRAYILKFILANWRLVKIGTTQAQRKLFFNLRKEKRQARGARHRRLVGGAGRAALDVPEREVVDMEKRLAASDLSLDAPVSRDGDDGRTQMESMEGALPRPDAQVEGAEFRGLLREKFALFAATLEGRERTLFEERLMNDHAEDAAGDRRDLRHQPRARAPAGEAPPRQAQGLPPRRARRRGRDRDGTRGVGPERERHRRPLRRRHADREPRGHHAACAAHPRGGLAHRRRGHARGAAPPRSPPRRGAEDRQLLRGKRGGADRRAAAAGRGR